MIYFSEYPLHYVSVGTSHMSINQHMSVAMQQLVDFISMVTQQYVTTQLRYYATDDATM
jgi:hypothetical protein